HERFDRGIFSCTNGFSEAVEEISADETCFHRPGNEQGHPRAQTRTNARSEGTHDGRIDRSAAQSREGIANYRRWILPSLGSNSKLNPISDVSVELKSGHSHNFGRIFRLCALVISC